MVAPEGKQAPPTLSRGCCHSQGPGRSTTCMPSACKISGVECKQSRTFQDQSWWCRAPGKHGRAFKCTQYLSGINQGNRH